MKCGLTRLVALLLGSLSGIQTLYAQALSGGKETVPGSTEGVSPEIHGRAGGRSMVPNDLLEIQKFDSTMISPDGKMVAIVVNRWAPGGSSFSNHRNELWVVERQNGERKRITPSAPVTLSHSNPVWSPDSKQLALLSNESQNNAFLEVWDPATGRIRRLSNLGVDTDAQVNHTRIVSGDDGGAFAWIDSQHLIVLLLPEARHSNSLDDFSRALSTQSAGLQAESKGKVSTAVLVSSPYNREQEAELPVESLVILDATTGSSRVLDKMPAWQARMAERDVVLSPNGEWAAIVNSTPPSTETIDNEAPISMSRMLSNRLGLVRLERSHGIQWIEGFRPEIRGIPGYITLDWRADSAAFAIWGKEDENQQAICVDGVEVARGQLYPLAHLDIHRFNKDGLPVLVNRIAWLPDNQIAV